MFSFTNAELFKLAIHRLEPKDLDGGLYLSDKETLIEDDLLKTLLLRYYTSQYKESLVFRLYHESDLALNEVYHFAKAIFKQPEALLENSRSIAKHLYQCSDHHNIKPGEFTVAYLKNCVMDGELTDAIVLVKTETKDVFIKVSPDLSLGRDEGINISKADKACIIFALSEEDGYRLCVLDNTNRSDAQYWKDNFLRIKPREDSYYHTVNYLQMCKNFCLEVLDKGEQIEKADQIDFLNRSSEFFTSKEVFNVKEFEEEVIGEPTIVDKFRGFKDEFNNKHQLNTFDEFDINTAAVKQKKKIFKSILKLDKNFHIYIHGDRSLIEKGYDEEKGMNYYKTYFFDEYN